MIYQNYLVPITETNLYKIWNELNVNIDNLPILTTSYNGTEEQKDYNIKKAIIYRYLLGDWLIHYVGEVSSEEKETCLENWNKLISKEERASYWISLGNSVLSFIRQGIKPKTFLNKMLGIANKIKDVPIEGKQTIPHAIGRIIKSGKNFS